MTATSPAIAYTTGGTVQAGGGLYLTRKADADLLQACRAGVFAYVLTARQIGKSSLMTRTAEQLRAEGVHAVVIDLQAIGVQVTAEQWYLGLLVIIEEQLMLDTDVIGWWMEHTHLGFTQRFTQFFDQVLLPEVTGQVVIFVDEIDTVLSLDFTDDFFIAIRYLQVNRAQQPELERLSFVLLGVAAPSDLIRDRQRTPFNIGQRIDLTDFTREEAQPFATGLQLPEATAQQVLEWVLDWTGGHPYLTQRLCQVLVERQPPQWTKAAIEQAVADTFFGDQSQQDNNLQFVRDMLLRRAPDVPASLQTYRDTWRNKTVEDEEQSLVKSHLKLSGIVKRDGTILTVRNFIYRQVFNAAWIREHLPDTWWDRIKPAMPLLVGMFVVGSLLGITGFAVQQQRLAQEQERLAEERTRVTRGYRVINLIQDERQRNLFTSKTILLAIEAFQRLLQAGFEPRSVDEFLRHSLQATPLPVGQPIVHQNRVEAIEFSPDGKYVATASKDKTARIVEVQTGQEVRRISHQDVVEAIAFSPDGRYIATASWDMTAQVTEISTGQEVAQIKHQDVVYGVAFSPDSKYVASASKDNTARVVAIQTNQEVIRITHKNTVKAVAFSPNGRYVATASWDKTARITDIQTKQLVHQIFHKNDINDVTFSPDSQYVATASYDNTGRVSEVSTGKQVANLEHQNIVFAVAFSPDGKYVATASKDNTAAIREVRTGKLMALIRHQDAVYHLAFSADGKSLATASRDRRALVSPVTTGQPIVQIANESAILHVAFSPDRRYLATASQDGTARISDITARYQTMPPPHQKGVNSLDFSDDGKYVASASDDQTAQIIDTATGQLVAQIPHLAEVQAVAFSPDGQYVVTGSRDKTAKVSETRTGKLVRLIKHNDEVFAVAISPNGQYVATASLDKTAQISDLKTGKRVARIQHGGQVIAVAFSPDSNYVITGSEDKIAQIHEIDTGKLMRQISHDDQVFAVAFSHNGQFVLTASMGKHIFISAPFNNEPGILLSSPHKDALRAATLSPDDQYLATASFDGTARIFELKTLKEISQIRHSDRVNSVVFSPDGRYVVTASGDQTAQISETLTGREIARIPHQKSVYRAIFSPDGKHLASASNDGMVQISLAHPEDLIAAACKLVSTNLSQSEWREYFDKEPYRETCPGLPPGPEVSE